MHLLYILISFALFAHVSVTKLDDYIQEVILTNDDIERAKELMPEIIKNIIGNPDEYRMEAMAFMLAIPEKIDCELLQPEFRYQNPVGENPSQSPDLNLELSTSSDEESENPDSVGKIIMHFDDKLEYQKMMQSAIRAVTDPKPIENLDLNLDQPTVTEEDPNQIQIQDLNLDQSTTSEEDLNSDESLDLYLGKERVDAPPIKLENLASVLEKRRIHPTGALKNKIIRTFDLPALGRARREMTLEAVTLLLRQNDPLFLDFKMMCRLVGVFRSIKYPHTYTHLAGLDEQFCIIIDATFEECHIYKFINGELWEVDIDTSAPIERFSQQALGHDNLDQN